MITKKRTNIGIKTNIFFVKLRMEFRQALAHKQGEGAGKQVFYGWTVPFTFGTKNIVKIHYIKYKMVESTNNNCLGNWLNLTRKFGRSKFVEAFAPLAVQPPFPHPTLLLRRTGFKAFGLRPPS